MVSVAGMWSTERRTQQQHAFHFKHMWSARCALRPILPPRCVLFCCFYVYRHTGWSGERRVFDWRRRTLDFTQRQHCAYYERLRITTAPSFTACKWNCLHNINTRDAAIQERGETREHKYTAQLTVKNTHFYSKQGSGNTRDRISLTSSLHYCCY